MWSLNGTDEGFCSFLVFCFFLFFSVYLFFFFGLSPSCCLHETTVITLNYSYAGL